MSKQLRCLCGEVLLDRLDDPEVTTLDGERMVFRRNTDFVLCFNCLRLYRVSGLREGVLESALYGHVTPAEEEAPSDGQPE